MPPSFAPPRIGLGGSAPGVFVDPRSEAEYTAGHLPGAVHLPYEKARTDAHVLDAYGVLMVYGNDYNSPLAVAMSKTLIDLGYKDVRTLRGGIRAWEDAGNLLEKGPPVQKKR